MRGIGNSCTSPNLRQNFQGRFVIQSAELKRRNCSFAARQNRGPFQNFLCFGIGIQKRKEKVFYGNVFVTHFSGLLPRPLQYLAQVLRKVKLAEGSRRRGYRKAIKSDLRLALQAVNVRSDFLEQG